MRGRAANIGMGGRAGRAQAGGLAHAGAAQGAHGTRQRGGQPRRRRAGAERLDPGTQRGRGTPFHSTGATSAVRAKCCSGWPRMCPAHPRQHRMLRFRLRRTRLRKRRECWRKPAVRKAKRVRKANRAIRFPNFAKRTRQKKLKTKQHLAVCSMKCAMVGTRLWKTPGKIG